MLRKYVLILLIMVFIGFPIIMVFLLNVQIFSVAPGQVESWITFWGSYIGAIIGASAVYFVSRFQIHKQNEQQIKAIEIENKQSTKREMKKFQLINKLEKIEEIQKILNNISLIIIDLNNEFVEFNILIETKEKNVKSKRNIDPHEEIYRLRKNLQKKYFLVVTELSRLSVLSSYVGGFEKQVLFLQENYIKLHEEIRGSYYSEELHEGLKMNDPNEPYLIESAELLLKKISFLNTKTLHKELTAILGEIENYTIY